MSINSDRNLPSSDSPDVLTDPAKRAIRSYMLEVVTPSVVTLAALSILSAIFGYFFNEGVRGSAYAKAYGDASKSVVDTAAAAGLARGQAELLLVGIKAASETVTSLADQITKSKLQVDEFLTKNFESIAQTLLRDEQFKASLARVSQEQFGVIESKLDVAKASIGELSRRFSDLQNVQVLSKADERIVRFGGGTLPIDCPKGYTVVGVQVGSESFVIRCGQLLAAPK